MRYAIGRKAAAINLGVLLLLFCTLGVSAQSYEQIIAREPGSLSDAMRQVQVFFRENGPFTDAWNAPIERVVPESGHTVVVSDIDPRRPRLMFTRHTLQRMEERVAAERSPWYESWLDLWTRADYALQEGISARPYTGDDSLELHKALSRDGMIIRDLAMAFLIDGNDEYAYQALEMLDAWASALPLPGTALSPQIRYPDSAMDIARGILPMVEAYDLVTVNPRAGNERRKRIEGWFRSLVDPIKQGTVRWEENNYFGKQYYQNHLAAHCAALTAIGYAVGDEELVQYALDSPENPRDFRELIEGMILMPGDAQITGEGIPTEPLPRAGEIIDRYRTVHDHGLAYVHLSLGLMAYTAEMAWNNGIDFWSYRAPGGESLELAFEFYAPIWTSKDSSLQGGYYAKEKVSDDNAWRAGIYEVAHRHYPDNKPVQRFLRSVDRTSIATHPHSYFGQPTLTHGEPLETEATIAQGAQSRLIQPEITNSHPRFTTDRETLEMARSRVEAGREPWKSAWEVLREQCEGEYLRLDPNPYNGAEVEPFGVQLDVDGRAAETLALAWWISGEEKYARKAREILMAWASLNPKPTARFPQHGAKRDPGMWVMRNGIRALRTYDLLYVWEGFSETDKKVCREWFLHFIDPALYSLKEWHDNAWFGQPWQNHLLAQTAGLYNLGIVLGDRELAQFALDSVAHPRDLKEMHEHLILMPSDVPLGGLKGAPLHAGEIMDRYRTGADYNLGIPYAHLCLALFTQVAQTASLNGLDLFEYVAPGGENLELCYEFYADFFRTKDPTLRGGYYANEARSLVGDWQAGIFEVALRHYPRNRAIAELLLSIDRPNIRRHPFTYFVHPILTHGIEVDPSVLASETGTGEVPKARQPAILRRRTSVPESTSLSEFGDNPVHGLVSLGEDAFVLAYRDPAIPTRGLLRLVRIAGEQVSVGDPVVFSESLHPTNPSWNPALAALSPDRLVVAWQDNPVPRAKGVLVNLTEGGLEPSSNAFFISEHKAEFMRLLALGDDRFLAAYSDASRQAGTARAFVANSDNQMQWTPETDLPSHTDGKKNLAWNLEGSALDAGRFLLTWRSADKTGGVGVLVGSCSTDGHLTYGRPVHLGEGKAYPKLAVLSPENSVLLAQGAGDSGQGLVYPLALSGKNLQAGKPVSASQSTADFMSVLACSPERFLVGYRDRGPGSQSHGIIRAGRLVQQSQAGPSIELGKPRTFSMAHTSLVDLIPLSDERIAAVYADAPSRQYMLAIFTRQYVRTGQQNEDMD